MQVSYPPGAPVRTMGVVPLKNILLDPAPADTFDLQVEQHLLLVDQQCSFGGVNAGIDNTRTVSAELDPCSACGTDTSRKCPDRRVTGGRVRVLDHDYLVEAGWEDTDLAEFAKLTDTGEPKMVYTRAEWRYPEIGRTDGRAPDIYNYRNQTAIKFTYSMNDATASIYSLSPDGDSRRSPYLTPLACHTTLVPIKHVAGIMQGTNSTSVLVNYTQVRLEGPARQLLESALQLSSMAVEAMANCSYRSDATFAAPGAMQMIRVANRVKDGYPDVERSAVGAWEEARYQMSNEEKCSYLASMGGSRSFPLLPLTIKVCRPCLAADDRFEVSRSSLGPVMVNYDSCITSEFEKLVFSHLLWLSSLPADVPEQQWLWGELRVVFYPVRWYALLLLGLSALLAGLLVALLGLSYAHGWDLVDTAPWSLAANEVASLHTSDMQEWEQGQSVVLKAMKSTGSGKSSRAGMYKVEADPMEKAAGVGLL